MAEIKLAAEKRDEFGKGAARRVRRAGRIPAVLYGHGTDPVHITLPGHETMLALRQANVLLEIDLAGEKAQLALPKQVQKDPVKNAIEHVDLLIVKRGEKVTVDIPVVTVGEHGPETVMMMDITSLSVEADATKLPEQIEIDIEGRVAPDQILAGDIQLPQGTTLITDPESLVINFTLPISEAALEAELEVPEGEGAADEAAAAKSEAAAEAPAEGDAQGSAE